MKFFSFLRPLFVWLAARRDACSPYFGLADVNDFWLGARPTFDPEHNATHALLREQTTPPRELATLEEKLERVEAQLGNLPPYTPIIIIFLAMFVLDTGANTGFLYNQGVTGWWLCLAAPAMTTVLFALATSTMREKSRRDNWLVAVRVLFALIATGIGWLQYQQTIGADEQDALAACASALIWASLVTGPALVAHALGSKLAQIRPKLLERNRIARRIREIRQPVENAAAAIAHIENAGGRWDDEVREIRGTYRRTWARVYLKKFNDPEMLNYFLTTEAPLPRPKLFDADLLNPYARTS